MTKKDFELVADVIKSMPGFAPSLRDQKASCAQAFAARLTLINPRFDRERFLKACGVQ